MESQEIHNRIGVYLDTALGGVLARLFLKSTSFLPAHDRLGRSTSLRGKQRALWQGFGKCVALCCLLTTSIVAAEPIKLHPDNPHYFLFRGRPTLLITSG